MRLAPWGVFVVAALAVGAAGAWWGQTQLLGQAPPTGQLRQSAPSDQLIAMACDGGDGQQQLTLIDPKTRVIGVYHIDRSTGQIALRCVRNVHYDLMMEEFNGADPSPREIRALINPR